MGFVFAKVGLALGGGGARGIGHVGVIRAFEEHGTLVSCVSGTSVGAVVAALYAFGRNSREIEDFFQKISFSRISSIIGQKLGLVGNQRLAEALEKELGLVDIKDAIIPLAIVCTDLITGEKKVFTEGPLAIIVQGSACFPGLFSPVEFGGMLLVDGAITENVPVSATKLLGANFIVAVSLSDPTPNIYYPTGMMDVVSRCFDILVDATTEKCLKEADYVIRLDLNFISRFRLSEKNRAIQIGYQCAQKMFSRSLFYWWAKPIVDYARQFILTLETLAKSIAHKPNLKIPRLEKKPTKQD